MPQVQDNPSVNVSAKSIAKYTLLPGILPRLQRLAAHLSQFLFMFTQIFGSVGLIDKNHPCLRPENIGYYRFRDIMGLAASNVVFDRKHIPQIVMFFTVVLSLVISAAILIAFIANILIQVPQAQAQLFGTPEGAGVVRYAGINQDWAMNFLYRIFGETGIFPKPADSNYGNEWYRMIMGGMLRYYSLAMLVVAALMIMYILIITVTESARTGQPFGSRFDGIWAPVRLALAIGLLMPVASGGYNGAQMMVLQSAVWGSNLATNVWYGGLNQMQTDSKRFFTTMLADPGYRFVRDMFLVNLCVAGLKTQKDNKTLKGQRIQYIPTGDGNQVSFVFGTSDAPDFCGQVNFLIKPKAPIPQPMQGKPYWPNLVAEGYSGIMHDFLPVGEITNFTTNSSGIVRDAVVTAPKNLMANMVNHVANTSFNSREGQPLIFIKDLPAKYKNGTEVQKWMEAYWKHMGVQFNCKGGGYQDTVPSCETAPQKTTFFHTKKYDDAIEAYNNWIIGSMVNDAQFGWTTAGVFYLRITTALSNVSEVVNNVPVVTKLPSNLAKPFATTYNPSANTDIMKEQCSTWWQKINVFGWGETAQTCEKYQLSLKINAFLRGGKDWFLSSVQNDPKVYGLVETQKFDRALEIPEPDTSTNPTAATVTSPVLDGLAGMVQIDSKNMNPLGTVVSWGNWLIALGTLAFAIGLAGNGQGWTDIAFTLGSLMIVPGFVLAFWIPTVPFMHFVFAVIEWMVSIMEAVIGMPLWALSLITLEGDGLGKTGMAGVKRIFEIILRPTIIILSLVASVLIFTAGVSFFNSALAMYGQAQDANTHGIDNVLIAPIQGLGMVFVYMFGIYSLANACFKLIDTIPDNFGRWMGLEKGFGGNMKSGFGELSGLIVGGAAIKGIESVGKGIGANQKAAKGKRDGDKAKAAQEQRLQDLLASKQDK